VHVDDVASSVCQALAAGATAAGAETAAAAAAEMSAEVGTAAAAETVAAETAAAAAAALVEWRERWTAALPCGARGRLEPALAVGPAIYCSPRRVIQRERKRRFRVCEEAPGFRPGPRRHPTHCEPSFIG